MWCNPEDHRDEQLFSFKPENLKPQLEKAYIGRNKELDEALAKFKKDIVSKDYIDVYDAYHNERLWWRLFIRRAPKCTIPTQEEIDALTNNELQGILHSISLLWYPENRSERYKRILANHGNIGVYIFEFCYDARESYRDTWRNGSKWIEAWQDLRRRLQGPPPAELVQMSGVVLASMQYYASRA